MAIKAVLRHAEEPPASPRTPERQALSEAVERYKAASERVARLQQALSNARYDNTDQMGAIGAAEAALAEARETAPKRRAAEILGEEVPPGISVEEASRALNSAQAQYDENKGAVDILEVALNDDVAGAKARASRAQTAVQRALAEVLAADPALGELVEAFDSARAQLAELSAVFRFLGLTRLPDNLQTWFSENRVLPPRSPLVPAWKDAIAALERGEVDKLLPTA